MSIEKEEHERALVRSDVYREDSGGQGSRGAKRVASEQEVIPQKLGEKTV